MSELRVEGAIYIRVEKTASNFIPNQDKYLVSFVNATTFLIPNDFLIPANLLLYTNNSVNESLTIIADGVKFYWYDNVQNFSDQYAITDHTLTFLEQVGRLEIKFINKLILR